VFVFEDMEQPSSDTEGKVAVGGNATFSNYSIGAILNNSYGTEDVPVVGGYLLYNSSAVYNGNVVYDNSTIQSPNTILNRQSNYSFPNFIVPKIDISKWSDKYVPIGNMCLYDAIKVDEAGNIFVINGALQKYYEKLKQSSK
jgi:choice-of-anchor A domain-containing protein